MIDCNSEQQPELAQFLAASVALKVANLALRNSVTLNVLLNAFGDLFSSFDPRP